MTEDELAKRQRRMKALLVMVEFVIRLHPQGISRLELRQILLLDGVNLDIMLHSLWRANVFISECGDLLFIDAPECDP